MNLKKFQDLVSRKTLRTHTPIHAGFNAYLPKDLDKFFKYDLSEIAELDDLHNAQGFIKQAQQKTAELFQVEHSFFSVNGASACLMAACLALGEGGKVLIPRNAHKSIIAGLLLSGADPIWYEPEWDSKWGLYRAIDANKIQDLIKRHNNIKACFVTNPTYEGIASSLTEIVSICHENNLPVIADESHGAHLSLLYEGQGAINDCADVIIHSPHKALGALTQTGLIHIQSEFIAPSKIISGLSLLQTTSPSFLLLLSLIQTLESLSTNLRPLKKQMWLAFELRKRLNKIPGLELIQNNDPTRCLLALDGWSGYALSEWLFRNYQIETELESDNFVLFLIGLGAKWHQITNLQKSLEKALKSKSKNNYLFKPQAKPEQFLYKNNPRKAYLNSRSEQIKFKCPPGIPTQIPGLELNIQKVYSKKENLNPYFEEDFNDDPEDNFFNYEEQYEEEFA